MVCGRNHEGKPLPLNKTNIGHRGGATAPSMVEEGKQQGVKCFSVLLSTTQKLVYNSIRWPGKYFLGVSISNLTGGVK